CASGRYGATVPFYGLDSW
nr:immunoglobulin heavy chain junction region [Macaca mulatta]MOV91442.1 immunoglobulin heavy chain junction region [Macaca mulatta]MOV92152.1 immunoglobulin heavy chain junction region [Macaca mulatta]